MAGFCIPILVSGTMFGILANNYFPSFYLLILISLLLTVITIVNIFKMRSSNQKEKYKIKNKKEFESNLIEEVVVNNISIVIDKNKDIQHNPDSSNDASVHDELHL